MLARPLAYRGAGADRLQPGDILGSGESPFSIATAGAGSLIASAVASGLIVRTGPGAGFNDTFDTADNIIAALSGNMPRPDSIAGLSFRLLYLNGVAFAMTAVTNKGIILGANVNVAASLWREYLLTILNDTPAKFMQCNTTNASPVVTLVTPINIGTVDTTGNRGYGQITPGMTAISAGNITAGTTVIGVTQGQGVITGFTLSANALATTLNAAVELTPTINILGLRSGTA